MCTLFLFIVGFSVLLQLNVVLFYLNVIVYKYERKRMLLLLRRRLQLCRKINLYRIKKENPTKTKILDTTRQKQSMVGKFCQRICASFRIT